MRYTRFVKNKDYLGQDASEADLLRVRGNALLVLDAFQLRERITNSEIEAALVAMDSLYDHPLLLGVLMRCIRENNEDLVEKWLTGLSAWKNTTPHPDLDGLSPFAYGRKYPTGHEERRIVSEIMPAYQSEMSRRHAFGKEPTPENLEEDFNQFQKNYLELVPMVNPFAVTARKQMNNREIIVEERRRAGVPAAKLNDIGLCVKGGVAPEMLGEQAAKLDDEYQIFVKKMAKLQEKSPIVDTKRLSEYYHRIKALEPYMKSQEWAWIYYANLGFAAYYLKLTNEAQTFLGLALQLNPTHEQSREMLAVLELQ